MLEELGRRIASLVGRHRLAALSIACATLLGTASAWVDYRQRQTLAEAEGPGALPPGPAPSCEVVDVVDGGTFTLDCGYDEAKPRIYTVGLHCIKAPPLDQQPWGIRARDHLKSIAAHAVAIEPVAFSGTQLVARIHDLDGELNLQMIADGFATVDLANCNDQRYYDAERRAMEEKKGFWAGETSAGLRPPANTFLRGTTRPGPDPGGLFQTHTLIVANARQ